MRKKAIGNRRQIMLKNESAENEKRKNKEKERKRNALRANERKKRDKKEKGGKWNGGSGKKGGKNSTANKNEEKKWARRNGDSSKRKCVVWPSIICLNDTSYMRDRPAIWHTLLHCIQFFSVLSNFHGL